MRDARVFAAKAAAPYLAVVVGLLVLGNAFAALALYHAQILAWRRGRWTLRGFGAVARAVGLVGVTLPLAAALLPVLVRSEPGLGGWFADVGLTGARLLLLVPYFGIVHPVLEQTHWRPLREEAGWRAHLVFAGYHGLVLWSVVEPVWLAVVLAGLACASRVWQWLDRRHGWPMSAGSHVAADLGIVVAATWLVARP